ncbi:type I-B CRISPR-associated protein Cas5b [Thermicanus aegyptius]|uniref:type I-B CRISPR-associated protein Cas5b n=1 Tax=Thermicanus aegyptius TaxID=94009 RepID=UPI00040A2DE3|nr:type I-B CRISPR-associated protein Cas5b [Thermicanus aegyptius]
MEVLKLEFEGMTASFRYPHYTWGRQPTYFMPPPSTIYGLISAAIGNWVDPHTMKFAYQFQYESKSEDLEHVHAVSASGGSFPYQGQKVPKNLDGNINPIQREFLYHPKLTLYLDRLDFREPFLEPRYPLVLGRSQDLITLLSAKILKLQESDKVYFEHTLLPWEWRPLTRMGITVMMPQFIDTANERQVTFARFIILQQRLYSLQNEERSLSNKHVMMQIGHQHRKFWFDPEMDEEKGYGRGVIFHEFFPQ